MIKVCPFQIMSVFVADRQLNNFHHFDTESLTTSVENARVLAGTIVLFRFKKPQDLSNNARSLKFWGQRDDKYNLITIPVKRLIAFANDFWQTCRKQSDFDSLFECDRQIFLRNFWKISVLPIITSQTPGMNRDCSGYGNALKFDDIEQSRLLSLGNWLGGYCYTDQR